MKINGDLLASESGCSSIGVDQTVNGGFDIASLSPFLQIHQVSGVFHDPLYGQSGVLRFSQTAGAFEVSVDGGATFNTLSAGAGVDSVGVLGGTNLTGNIDLASAANSGFLAIFDTANASPIQFAVDQLGLSGLWDFPAQGFNGSIVNELVDFNGTSVQGSVTIEGASGIIVDIVGDTITIATDKDISNVPECYTESFVSQETWTVTHNLGTTDVIASVYDGSSPALEIIPDEIELTDANTVTVSFNKAQTGKIVVIGCN